MAKYSVHFIIGLFITVVVGAMAVVSWVWTPYDPTVINIANKLQTPNAVHLLGTDHFGRDILSRLMVGGWYSLTIALGALVIGMGVGVPLGLVSASHRGWVGDTIMRGNDFVFAFPSLILAILFTAIWGGSALNAVLAIGIFNIPVFARITHGGALALWGRDFVTSAIASGHTTVHINIRHILPNVLPLLIVQGAVQFSLAIVIESGLSYLGLGTQPPTPSWGKMLAESQTMLSFAPHLAIFSGGAIVVTVWGLNLLGDGLQKMTLKK